MLCESRIAEEKAKKAMIDAARLADELRGEQETAQYCEKTRRALEHQVKDMQVKLDDAEQLAVKGGRKVTSRLDQKIKDLESQFDDEQRRLVEAEKSQRRTTRRIKELTFSQDEDHKNHERMQELVDKLQNKVKSYKKQIEEAEEIAALNLAKFRKVQADLESSEERADINEQVTATLILCAGSSCPSCRCWPSTRPRPGGRPPGQTSQYHPTAAVFLATKTLEKQVY